MKLKKGLFQLPFLLSGLLLVGEVMAGTVFETTTTDASGTQDTGSIAIQDGNIKIELNDDSENGEMIFRSDMPGMIMISHSERSYTTMDQSTLDGIAKQINSAMEQMHEAMKDMPPQQREMMEQMMMGRMPQIQVEGPEVTLLKLGSGGEVNGFSTEKYQVSHDGRPVRNLWVADWSDVDKDGDVREGFLAMTEFLESLLASLPQVAATMENPYELLNELEGMPVRTEELDSNGQVESTSDILAMQERQLDASVFDPPSGYKAQQMPGLN